MTDPTTSGSTNPFLAIVSRDIRLAFKSGGGSAQAVIFFGLIIVLFVLSLGPEPALLARTAAPIVWTGVLLSSLLSLDRMFQADFEDGSLDILVQRTPTLSLLVLAKALSHWVTTAAPLIVAAPVMAILAGAPEAGLMPLLVSLLAGTPALSLTGAIAAALTFPMRRANVLITILIGPLFAPVIIFGSSAANSASFAGGDQGLINPAVLFLGAATLFTLLIAPLAGAAAIRFNIQS
ncbi:MAG: heme exporter protein CcmB [Pseudomonadota bacterium]